ncbi:hypothetical protein C2S51_030290 [Perilla frutescens var. frutescens]|nr:hypothetical protein C2S51_030290 [Perilla frutescens var. frutescens]
MEFLSCAFEGRALLFADDTDFAVDGLTKSRNPLRKWDGEDAVDNIGFIEPLLPDTMSKSFLDDKCLESNGDDGTKDHSGKPIQSDCTITLNTWMASGTRFSAAVNKANDDEKFASARHSKGDQFSVENSVLSSPEPSVLAKRTKTMNSPSPVPTCQVYRCNKNLSSSKDYHKRHKVCDAHSKTAVVIVNGIKQRFCQQCSRFHKLGEFDEGKRSCRKRLAGHNERRRKPQFNTHLGSTYFTTDVSNSIIFSRILHGGFFCLNGNAPSQLQEFYASSDSSCALSLLSARKQNFLSNSAGMSMAHSLISTGNYHATNLFTAQNSATNLGESSSRFVVGSETPPTALPPEPNTLNLKSYLSPEGADTVDLLELSFHLQRVEQQKYYGQIKMENDIFCDSTMA